MRVGIVGAGVGGRALWRFLELEGGHDVEIFDIKHKTRCGISPCGWAVYTRDFYKVHNDLQLPVKTLINTYGELQVGDMSVKCDLSTFDKPAFLMQMCDDGNIQFDFDASRIDDYDLVVDATGVNRALLPDIQDDLKIMCRQELYKTDIDNLPMCITPSGSVGYAWAFPLDNNTIHIGGAFLKDEAFLIRPETVQMLRNIAGVTGTRPECSCKSEIRMLSPRYCEPIVWRNVVGVAESGGTVSSLCGAGVVPAIESAMLLADNIDNTKRYEYLLISDFSYLDREVTILRKIGAGKRLGVSDIIVMRNNAARFGIFYGWKDAIKTIKMVGGRLL